MNSKIILLSVAVIAVGLFALPSTMSLFAGQHTWYDPKELSCFKCHQDVKDELAGSENKVHGEAWAQACEGCHKTPAVTVSGNSTLNGGTPFFYTSGLGANRTKQGFHAATTLECVACHSGVAVSAYSASNYNSTTGTWADYKNSLGNPQEAHTAFANAATSTRVLYNDDGTVKSSTGNQSQVMLKGANTACVGCHTHIWVNATWKRNSGYGFTADESSGSYELSFWLNSTVVETSVAANQGT